MMRNLSRLTRRQFPRHTAGIAVGLYGIIQSRQPTAVA